MTLWLVLVQVSMNDNQFPIVQENISLEMRLQLGWCCTLLWNLGKIRAFEVNEFVQQSFMWMERNKKSTIQRRMSKSKQQMNAMTVKHKSNMQLTEFLGSFDFFPLVLFQGTHFPLPRTSCRSSASLFTCKGTKNLKKISKNCSFLVITVYSLSNTTFLDFALLWEFFQKNNGHVNQTF